jgi:4-amino-4-deoxy-L-arabinose transferase-like glycosyltransferase
MQAPVLSKIKPKIKHLSVERLLNTVLLITFGIVFVATAINFAEVARDSAHGEWDAWGIWNQRARFLYYGAGAESFMQTDAIVHPEYPLLLPLLNAAGWHLAGGVNTTVSILIAALFTFGAPLLIVVAMPDERGFAAGIFLLGMKGYIRWGTAQYADVPLAFFILASVMCFAFGMRRPMLSPMLYGLAGVCAGFALHTKNEGILFALIAAALFALYQIRVHRSVRQVMYFAIGIAPALILWVIYKANMTAVNDLVAGQGASTFERLTDLSRYELIVRLYGGQFVQTAFIAAAAYTALRGSVHPFRADVLLNVGIITLLMVGYFFVYVTTPRDLVWHLEFSADRLVLHGAPAVMFLIGWSRDETRNKDETRQ